MNAEKNRKCTGIVEINNSLILKILLLLNTFQLPGVTLLDIMPV